MNASPAGSQVKEARPTVLVIGDPIDHSLSPIMHQAGYEATQLSNWDYQKARVAAGQLPAFLADLPANVQGLSVTMPQKEAALATAGSSTAVARHLAAANTLVRTAAGWHADNTDAAGLQWALEKSGWQHRRQQPVVLFGSGATARAALAALHNLHVAEVVCVVRKKVRPETVALAERLGISLLVVSQAQANSAFQFRTSLETASLVISTVPRGATAFLEKFLPQRLSEQLLPQRPSGAHPASTSASRPVLLDVVYANWPTPLAEVAHRQQWLPVSGLSMLAGQAARQFSLFTGREISPELLLQAAKDHLSA